ncbi:MAG: helix-turn-helix transcriptional regulator [Actinomycetota bacterium]
MPEGRRSSGWRFLTNHAHVLLVVAGDGDLRIREIAERVGITERAAHSIIRDLIEEGYVSVIKEGRRNRYEVHPELPFRHPNLRDHDIGEMVRVLSDSKHT